MSTNELVVGTGRRRRRKHSDFFKAEAVGACQQSGVSIAAVALARGLNANLLRAWVRRVERSGAPIAIRPTLGIATAEGAESFVPMPLAASSAPNAIRIEIRRNGGSVSIEWPTSAAQECAQLLRELAR